MCSQRYNPCHWPLTPTMNVHAHECIGKSMNSLNLHACEFIAWVQWKLLRCSSPCRRLWIHCLESMPANGSIYHQDLQTGGIVLMPVAFSSASSAFWDWNNCASGCLQNTQKTALAKWKVPHFDVQSQVDWLIVTLNPNGNFKAIICTTVDLEIFVVDTFLSGLYNDDNFQQQIIVVVNFCQCHPSMKI